MKSYNYETRRFLDTSTGLSIHDKERAVVKSYKEHMDALISSDEFIEKFKSSVEHLGMFKETQGKEES